METAFWDVTPYSVVEIFQKTVLLFLVKSTIAQLPKQLPAVMKPEIPVSWKRKHAIELYPEIIKSCSFKHTQFI
jgi:hypothetical protein